ncbi:MAG: hypothetical protein K6A37_10670 [Saccharofermentans sp.]|nr:hypothetical protein [Saccharofermentans sp.]
MVLGARNNHTVGPFIPTGIRITFYDEKKGKDRKYKMSVMGRAKWLSFLGQNACVV